MMDNYIESIGLRRVTMVTFGFSFYLNWSENITIMGWLIFRDQ